MVESALNGIVSWLAQKIVDIINFFLERIYEATSTTLLENQYINAILNIIQAWGMIVVGIAIVMSIMKTMLLVGEGQNVSLVASFKGWIVGIFVAIFGIPLAKAIFLLGSQIGTDLTRVFTTSDVPLDGMLAKFHENAIITLIVTGLVLFQIIKLMFNMLERSGQFFMLSTLMFLYVPMYIYGNEQAVWSWIKQIVAVAFSQALLITGTYLGMYLLKQGGGTIWLGLGMFFALNKIDQIMGQFSMSVGGTGSRLLSKTQGVGMAWNSISKALGR